MDSIDQVFQAIHEEVEKRRSSLVSEVKKQYKEQISKLDEIAKSMAAVQNRCRIIFPGVKPQGAFQHVKALERIIDF